MTTDIHSLPPEILGLITEWIGAMEAVENPRLLRSERKMCICEDEEEERYHRYRRSLHDLPFHSGVLKVSSLSRRFRNIIFESRHLRGISMPFYRSSLDRCANIRDSLKRDIRKLRVTVDDDPTASSEDRQTTISMPDLLRPFPNLTRLEIDHTVLDTKDPRISWMLHGVRNPVNLFEEGSTCADDNTSTDGSSVDTAHSAPDSESAAETAAGRLSMDDRSSIESDALTETCDCRKHRARNDLMRTSYTASTIESCHIRMLDKHAHWTEENSVGLYHPAVGQVGLILQQVHMPNLRHLHITWDFDLVDEYSGGEVLQHLAYTIGALELRTLEEIKFCVQMHVGLGNNYPTPVEDLTQDMAMAFDKPQWHGTRFLVNLIIKDGLYSGQAEYFDPEHPIEQLVAAALINTGTALPWVKDFSENTAFTPHDLSPEFELTVDVFARSAFFEGIVPIARVHHSTATHREGVDDPDLWRSHFELTRFEVDESALVEGARRVLNWDVNDATDSDYTPNMDDSSSDSASESAFSDSFRGSPTPL